MFGELVKARRLELGLSLRAFCMRHNEDPSNWSKMERGLLRPPVDYTRLLQIAGYLELTDGDTRRQQIFDLANAERGRIPEDIMSEAELVANLPVLFRTLRGDVPEEDELLRLADLIRKARTKA